LPSERIDHLFTIPEEQKDTTPSPSKQGLIFLDCFLYFLIVFQGVEYLQYRTVLAANGMMIVHWKRIGGK
jgi:hypothetical protein